MLEILLLSFLVIICVPCFPLAIIILLTTKFKCDHDWQFNDTIIIQKNGIPIEMPSSRKCTKCGKIQHLRIEEVWEL